MANNNKATPDVGRRASQRMSLAARPRDSYDDEEDYALEAMGISDGFRPTNVAANHAFAPSAASPAPNRESNTPSIRLTSPPPRPSSITKPRYNQDSFALRHDGASSDLTGIQRNNPNSHIHRARSNNGLTRELSVSTVSPFASPDDPYEGPSEPSHPYQMYPQNVRLARTASMATTSTAPVSEHSYTGPRGPTHPYGMYPQGTASDSDGAVSGSTDRTMVGFGSVDNYERRLGPEGEEAGDLIGPDGHTEQLPPYTRYPDEAYARKAMGVDSPRPPPARPVRSISGAGGLGLATRNPEFASTEDLSMGTSPQSAGASPHSLGNEPLSRQSVQSFHSVTSRHDINMGASGLANNEKADGNWQTTARKRVWGVFPCWAIGLAAVVLVLLGVVMGAVVGSVFGSQINKKPPPKGPEQPVFTITKDSTPYSTVPPGLPPLETGTFALPVQHDSMTRECFNDTAQSQAWQCVLVYSQLSMSIHHHPEWEDLQEYSLSFLNNDSFTIDQYVYSYGVQPPAMENEPLTLVRDTYKPEYGPAWAMEVAYNKTVVIPEDSLILEDDLSSDNVRRAYYLGEDFVQRAVAKEGDRPWICYWESTLFETFIYVEQDSSALSMSVAPQGSSSTPTPSNTDYTGIPPTRTPDPLADRTDYTSMGGLWYEHGGSQSPPPGDEDEDTDANETPTATTPPPITPGSPFYQNTSPTNTLDTYPRMVKIMERRIPSIAPSEPWCRQYMIEGPNKPAQPILDEDGDTIDVFIIENDANYGVGYTKRSSFEDLFMERREDSASDMSDCGCMWWLT